MKELIEVQKELKAPKSQYNSFGKYNYRNAEDILEAVKPLLERHGLVMTITDDVVEVGGWHYVKATVKISQAGTAAQCVSVSAFAREEETKKGMDAAQITGSASSYARKYALNGMFLIDDTKDPDCQDNRGSGNGVKPDGGNGWQRQGENGNPPPQQKKGRFTPEQGAEVNHLLNDFGAFTEDEKNEWRESLKVHKEWTAEQFIGMLKAVVDKNATKDGGELL